MSKFAVIWDLETIPDLAAFKRMCGTPDISDAEAQELHGDKFAKLPLHLIACIGAVIAERGDWGWRVTALGAPHIGHHSEAEIITRFVSRLEELRPQLVAFNSHGFDLPVLRYRAMVHSLSAPGLNCRSYFNRYSEDCLDLCDALASHDPRSKVSLDALCRVLGLPGKPDGIDGSKVSEYVKEGRIQEVADYCETDVVNTYRVFLRYELFRGNVTAEQHQQSESDLEAMLRAKVGEKPHLASLLPPTSLETTTTGLKRKPMADPKLLREAALRILAADDATPTNQRDAELALRLAEKIEGQEATALGSDEEPDPSA